jgi:hypothetical protein
VVQLLQGEQRRYNSKLAMSLDVNELFGGHVRSGRLNELSTYLAAKMATVKNFILNIYPDISYLLIIGS